MNGLAEAEKELARKLVENARLLRLDDPTELRFFAVDLKTADLYSRLIIHFAEAGEAGVQPVTERWSVSETGFDSLKRRGYVIQKDATYRLSQSLVSLVDNNFQETAVTQADLDLPPAVLKQLRDEMDRVFNEEELMELFHSYGEYENIPGSTKSAKIRGVIDYLRRRKILATLISDLKQLRSKTNWPDIER